jgi:hypothetical protein
MRSRLKHLAATGNPVKLTLPQPLGWSPSQTESLALEPRQTKCLVEGYRLRADRGCKPQYLRHAKRGT